MGGVKTKKSSLAAPEPLAAMRDYFGYSAAGVFPIQRGPDEVAGRMSLDITEIGKDIVSYDVGIYEICSKKDRRDEDVLPSALMRPHGGIVWPTITVSWTVEFSP